MNEQLSAAEGRLGRVVVLRLKPGDDLLDGEDVIYILRIIARLV